jgi:acetamidase/formamidase
MLGCFGVAPARGQAISCSTSGQHGGNMDYRGFRQGVTVYLPVFVPGALFQLGDGHATQGDGEITGTGTEISMDVTFTAWIHRKQQPISWPRAEDETWLMAAGNARPLDQALQHATTELMRWLAEDYTLDYRATSLLMGQCLRYDVGNVFDPAYTMVAKVEKRLVAPFKRSS